MKTLLIFALISVSIAQAADGLFLRVLSRLNNDGILPQQTLACQAGGQNAELAQTCAMQLCGDSQSAPTAYITEARIEEWTKPEIMARFAEAEEPLKKIIASNNKTNREALTNLRERLARGEMVLGPDTTSEGYEKLADVWFQNLLEFDFDLEKPLSERVQISVVDIPGHSPETKAALRAYVENYKQLLKNDFTHGCYYGVYSLEEAKVELNDRFALFDARYQEALKQNPAALSGQREQIEQIRRQLVAGDFDVVSSVGFSNSSLSYFDLLLAPLVSRPPLWTAVATAKCGSEDCRRGLAGLVAQTDWRKLADQLEARLSDPQLEQNQLTYCRSNFAALALKESETERIREALPRVKTQFLERVAKNFSSHSRSAFETYLNEKLSFNFAPDEVGSIDDEIQRLKDTASEAAPSDLTSSAKLAERLLEIKNPYADDLSLVTNANCGGLGVSAWDSFMAAEPGNESGLPTDGDPAKDNLQISHFSCTHPAQGEQILAHELGHALSQAFSDEELSESSYKEFLRMRSCVNGWKDASIPNMEGYVMHEGDAFRSEEDMADLVAYTYAADNPALMSCALLQPALESNQYVDPSISNPILFDSHSSPLTRAIREAMHKRLPIPTACQQLIGPESGMRFNTCF